jgi:hypothetical protein
LFQAKNGTGAGARGFGTSQNRSFSLGKHITVFQEEGYAIKACAVQDPDRDYKNRKIYILSASQAAIKALCNYQINKKLAWDCHQSLAKPAENNRAQLIWMSGHEGVEVYETDDQRAKLGSECLVTGSEPACGISAGTAKKAVREWTKRDHKGYWGSLTGFKQAKGYLQEPSARITKELL